MTVEADRLHGDDTAVTCPLQRALARELSRLVAGLGVEPSVRSSARPDYDLRIDLAETAAELPGGACEAVAERLGALPFVELVVVESPRLFVRVVDTFLRDTVLADVLRRGCAYGCDLEGAGESVMIIYSNPNANKPLHIGHLRDNFVGMAVSRLFESAGYATPRASLASDWGVHIAKAVLAYQRWGDGLTPDEAGQSGDQFVGSFYIRFSRANADLPHDEVGETELDRDARRLLWRMENGDAEIQELNDRLTGWVKAAHEAAYRRIGSEFDREVSEREALPTARALIGEQVRSGTCAVRDDGSVYLDHAGDDLWEVTMLRGDGTATVYAQHLGGKLMLFDEFRFDRVVLVYGRDWDMPYRASSRIYSAFELSWAPFLEGVGHGVVGLPTGRMRSRAGTVVNADPLLDRLAASLLEGWGVDATPAAREACDRLAVGLMKHYLLSVRRSKDVAFSEEALRERTLPLFARAIRALTKAEVLSRHSDGPPAAISPGRVRDVVRRLNRFPAMRRFAFESREPSIVVRYLDDLSVLVGQCRAGGFDPVLWRAVGVVLRQCFRLLNVDLPDRLDELPPPFMYSAGSGAQRDQSRTWNERGAPSRATAAV